MINRKLFSFLVVVLVLAMSATAYAAKPGSSSASLSVSFGGASALAADATLSAPDNSPYVVSGCGYGTGGVTVVVYGPGAAAFAGQTPTDGCISLSNFATDGAGTYHVDAYQTVRNKAVEVASTSFTVQ